MSCRRHRPYATAPSGIETPLHQERTRNAADTGRRSAHLSLHMVSVVGGFAGCRARPANGTDRAGPAWSIRTSFTGWIRSDASCCPTACRWVSRSTRRLELLASVSAPSGLPGSTLARMPPPGPHRPDGRTTGAYPRPQQHRPQFPEPRGDRPARHYGQRRPATGMQRTPRGCAGRLQPDCAGGDGS